MTATTTQVRFLFVGQRPSKRAEQIGATWQNGKLAACTLWKALEALGMDPRAQTYLNIWQRAEPSDQDAEDEAQALVAIDLFATAGVAIVGMGAIVCDWLTKHGVAFTKMTHPAARGAIRRQERYHRHVAEVLTGVAVSQ